MIASVPQISPADRAELEHQVDEWIAVCGGDMRETIRVLITCRNSLEDELAALLSGSRRQ